MGDIPYESKMNDQNKILDEFLTKTKLFNGFKDKTYSLINDLLYVNKIQAHQITCRVKNKESLLSKIERKKHKYSFLNDITDIIGIRIITYFEDDVDKIAKIIENEFEIDRKNSVDRRELEADKFGYRSLHYVV